MTTEREAELESKVATLSGALRVAEHRLHCAEIGNSHRDRVLGEIYEQYERLTQAYNRVWAEHVPEETKQRLEEQALIEKKQAAEQAENMMRLFGGKR